MNYKYLVRAVVQKCCIVIWFSLIFISTALSDTQFEDDDFWDDSTAEVNEGALEFLTIPPSKLVHHHQNIIRIKSSSLQDGWVELAQCHHHLDQVPRLEIVYNPQRIRSIQVVSSRNIGFAEVVGAKLSLSEVGAAAEICLTAESRALHSLGSGLFQLRNGPYMRRFLDGYYPMRLTLEVQYPTTKLMFHKQRPLPEEHVVKRRSDGVYKWSGWFTGKLSTEIDFKLINQ
ncbi:MAG: alpha/beta hydrolase [Candidatus Thiodiazotropha sp. L084R]